MAASLIDLGSAARGLGSYGESKQYIMEALRMGIETEAPVIVLSALTELAALQIRQGDFEAGLKLLAHILQHPAGMPETKERALRLRLDLAAQLSPQQVEAIQAEAQAKSFDAVVAEILEQM